MGIEEHIEHFGPEGEQICRLASKINSDLIDQVRQEDPRIQSSLAMMTLGTLLGTAYATEYQRSGSEAAHDWIVRTLQVTEAAAKHAGLDIGFTVIRKTE